MKQLVTNKQWQPRKSATKHRKPEAWYLCTLERLKCDGKLTLATDTSPDDGLSLNFVTHPSGLSKNRQSSSI